MNMGEHELATNCRHLLCSQAGAGAMSGVTLSTVMRTLPSRAYSACQALLGPVPSAFFLVSFCSKPVSIVDHAKPKSGTCMLQPLACPDHLEGRAHAGERFVRAYSWWCRWAIHSAVVLLGEYRMWTTVLLARQQRVVLQCPELIFKHWSSMQ